MAAYYFDSSAIVKRYVAESGSAWVNRIFDPAAGHRIYIARISAVEIASAVTRRKHDGSLSDENADAIWQRFSDEFAGVFRTVEMTRVVLMLAAELAITHRLRAYDAVQLAAALNLHRLRTAARLAGLQLVSSDLQLNAAAEATGISVVNPLEHK